VQEERPANHSDLEDPQTSNHSLPRVTLVNDVSPNPSEALQATVQNGTHNRITANVLQCGECEQTFAKEHLLNKHLKKHFPPFQCLHEGCSRFFQYRKDLRRHCEAKHPESVADAALLYCPYEGCKFSFQGGTGVSRRDNLNRHVRTQHRV